MRRVILFLFLSGTFGKDVWSQFDRGGAKTYENSHRHSAIVEVPFIHNDAAIGLTYRYSISGDKFLGVFGTFFARPYAKAILLKSAPRFYFQLQEYRFVLAGGLDKKIWINSRLDAFVGGGLGITLVDYRGTGEGVFMGHQIEKKQGLVPVVRAGVSYKFSRYAFLRMGYQYFDAKTCDGHRIYLGVGGQI